jgi:hypothetical protein
VVDVGPPDPPPVTVRGGPAERVPDPRAGALLRAVGLVLATAAVVLAVAQGQREERPRTDEQRTAVPVAASLQVVGRAVSVSQGGVLVVPVLLQDLGPGLTVTSARAYAEPVREDPVVTPPAEVAPAGAARFVVLLTPACELLTTRSRLAFRASLLLQVEQGGTGLPLVLDLGRDPVVARVVDGLCGRTPTADAGGRPG